MFSEGCACARAQVSGCVLVASLTAHEDAAKTGEVLGTALSGEGR